MDTCTPSDWTEATRVRVVHEIADTNNKELDALKSPEKPFRFSDETQNDRENRDKTEKSIGKMLVESKEFIGRPKDLAHLPVLKTFLKCRDC